MQDFSQMVQNTSAQATSQTDKTAATKEVSEVDEMAAFKQEIYEELAEIDKMNSSAILSNSVHITEDGFKRMKEDPEYRKSFSWGSIWCPCYNNNYRSWSNLLRGKCLP